MEVFEPFPLDSDPLMQERLSALLGAVAVENGKSVLLAEVFNKDVACLNNRLNHPPSVHRFYKIAYDLQEAYNAAKDQAKSRWQVGEQSYNIGKHVVKDLTERLARFNNAYNIYQIAEQRAQQLRALIGDTTKENEYRHFWAKLEASAKALDAKEKQDGDYKKSVLAAIKAIDDYRGTQYGNEIIPLIDARDTLDKNAFLALIKEHDKTSKIKCFSVAQEIQFHIHGRAQKLQILKKDWLSQQIFVLSSAQDLYAFKKNLDDFKAFLSHVKHAISENTQHPIDKKIQKLINNNMTKWEKAYQAMISAMGWRLNAGSLADNLRVDDPFFALVEEIKKIVFLYDRKEDIGEAFQMLQKASISSGHNFRTCEKTIKAIKQSNNEGGLSKWRTVQWCHQSKKYFIESALKNDALIPSILHEYIPEKPGYTITSWLHYWFFQAKKIRNVWLAWLRKTFIGSYSESFLFLNETIYQLDKFVALLKENENRVLDLIKFSQSAPFLDALEIIPILVEEKERAQGVKPSWTMGVLFGWIPFFNRRTSFVFFQSYDAILQKTEDHLKKQGQLVAEHLVRNIEIALIESIKKGSFLLPKNLMVSLSNFVHYYGNDVLIKKYKSVVDPINIIKAFDFISEQKNIGAQKEISVDNLFSFLLYAQTYWSVGQYEAAKAIAKVIAAETLPNTEAQQNDLFQLSRCLFATSDPKSTRKQFDSFMAYLAQHYIFETGDTGDDQQLAFLKKYYPSGASSWENERRENLDDKYSYIRYLLDVKKNQEISIDEEPSFNVFETILEYRFIGKYVADLNKAQGAEHVNLIKNFTQRYIEQYDGNNIRYHELVFALDSISAGVLAQYVSMRLIWLLDNHPDGYIGEADENFLKQCAYHKGTIGALCDVIRQKYDGNHQALDKIVSELYSPQLNGVYYAKRLQYLIAQKQFGKALDDEPLFEIIKGNEVFVNEMNDYFNNAIKDALQSESFREIETLGFCHMIEQYGTIENKEAYRILRVQKCLNDNDMAQTQLYFNTLLPYLKDIQTDFITLPKGKQLLKQIYEDELRECEVNQEWSGHLQYCLQYFSAGHKETLMPTCHLQWLRFFLSNPRALAEQAALERSTLDVKYHHENLSIPKKSCTLRQFYGNQTNQAFNIIMRRLDEYREETDDDVINLILRYIDDANFKTHDDYKFMTKKVEEFKQVQTILQAIQQGNETVIFKLFAKLINDYETQKELQDADKTGLKEKIIAHQEKILLHLYDSLLDAFKRSCVSFVEVRRARLQNEGFDLVRFKTEMMRTKQLPDEFKQLCIAVYDNRQQLLDSYQALYEYLEIETLHEISVTEEQLITIKQNMSSELRSRLNQRINMIGCLIPKEDSLTQTLQAMSLYFNGSNLSDEEEKRLLSATMQLNHVEKSYEKLANKLAEDIISILNNKGKINKLALFQDTESHLQTKFVGYVSTKNKENLLQALVQRIAQFDNQNIADIVSYRKEWVQYGELFGWLIKSRDINTKKMETDVQSIVQQSLQKALMTFQRLNEGIDIILDPKNQTLKKSRLLAKVMGADNEYDILKENLIEKENTLLRQSLLIRLFGNENDRVLLNNALEQILMRMRKAFMTGRSDTMSEHCINYADRLISTAGNYQQRQQYTKLLDQWHRYLVDGDDLSGLQKDAVQDSLTSYQKNVTSTMLSYFSKKFPLNQLFIRDIKIILHGFASDFNLNDYDGVKAAFKKYKLRDFLRDHLTDQSWHARRKIEKADSEKLWLVCCLCLKIDQYCKTYMHKLEKNALTTCDLKQISIMLGNELASLLEYVSMKDHAFQSDMVAIFTTNIDYFSAILLERDDFCQIIGSPISETVAPHRHRMAVAAK